MKIDSNNLPVMETFYSVQGEGFYSGKPAFFIRVGGCDVGCHWCDVKESWDHGDHEIISVDEIISNVIGTNLVIITGGEPLMWNMNILTKKLKENNMKVHLETSGAYKISGNWDWICLSPKKQKLPENEIYKLANELKIIIHNKNDLNFALQESKKVSKDCELYLQPEWGKFEKNKTFIVDFVKENPEWQISLQIHKFLNID